MTSFNCVPLGDLVEFRNGLNFPATSYGKGTKFIGVADFKDKFAPDYDDLSEVVSDGLIRSESLLKDGDILFVRSNGNKALVGRSLYIEDLKEPVAYSGFCIRARPRTKNFLPRYLAYFCKSQTFREAISSAANGATIQNLSQPILARCQVPLPSLEIQELIVDRLTNYDRLFSNNIKRIQLLEEMAQITYEEWFGRKRFPGHEVIERGALGGVLEGWQTLSFGELLSHEIGGGWGNDIFSEMFPAAAHVIRGTDIDKTDVGDVIAVPYRFHKESNLAPRKLTPGDIIFEVSGGSKEEGVAKTLLVSEGLLSLFEGEVICASFCKLVRPRDVKISNFLFHFLRSLRDAKQLEVYELRSASNIVNYNWSAFKKYQIVNMPPDELISKFNDRVENMHKQKYILARQNQLLREARDILLPRLMSGQIDVEKLTPETDLESAA